MGRFFATGHKLDTRIRGIARRTLALWPAASDRDSRYQSSGFQEGQMSMLHVTPSIGPIELIADIDYRLTAWFDPLLPLRFRVHSVKG